MIGLLTAAAITGAFGLTWGQEPAAVEAILAKGGYKLHGKVNCGLKVFEGPVSVGPLTFKHAGLIPWYAPAGGLTIVEARLLPENSAPRAFEELALHLAATYDAPQSFSFFHLDQRHHKTGSAVSALTLDEPTRNALDHQFETGALTAQGQVHLPSHGVLASGAGLRLAIPPGRGYVTLHYFAETDLAEELLSMCADAR
ncbi:MAG: hypothetical protein JWM80_3815 [Cyanobacteria bacterium RYN_339]|nr:hypothetical protein [Cyanobacteria bacterium RYN_339]